MLVIQDHFDLAARLGHSGVGHLAAAEGVYREARAEGHLDLARFDWRECLGVGSALTQKHRAAELDHLISAVVMFQAMLEKLLWWLPVQGSGLAKPPSAKRKFKERWEFLIAQIKTPSTKSAAAVQFEQYCDAIYAGARNPIVHGKDDSDLSKVNRLRFPAVHEGLQAGWAVYDALLAEVFAGHQTSWAQMCKIHGIPTVITASDYPDLEAVAKEFMKKHTDGVNGLT